MGRFAQSEEGSRVGVDVGVGVGSLAKCCRESGSRSPISCRDEVKLRRQNRAGSNRIAGLTVAMMVYRQLFGFDAGSRASRQAGMSSRTECRVLKAAQLSTTGTWSWEILGTVPLIADCAGRSGSNFCHPVTLGADWTAGSDGSKVKNTKYLGTSYPYHRSTYGRFAGGDSFFF